MEENKSAVDSAQGKKMDWLIQTLVEFANKFEMTGLQVTLITHGFAVSGILITGARYFDLVADQFASDNMRTALETIKNEVYGTDSRNNSLPSFIHLENARFYTPGNSGMPNNTGVTWRGKIEEVSGFMFGAMETSEN